MNLKTEAGKNSFYQWDTNQQLIVEDAPDCQEVHFSHRGDPTALVCSIYEADGERVVDVPNILLQQDKPITAYLFSRADDRNQTRHAWSFLVIGRPQPEDYVYTETEVLTYKALEERIIALEEGGGTVTDEQIATAVESYLEENPVEVPNVDLTGVVKSINGIAPDENGNVEITIPDSEQNGNGLTTTEKTHLLTILDAVIVETTKQHAVAEALAALKQLWSGGEVYVSQVGTTLAFENVATVTSITQNGTTLALA